MVPIEEMMTHTVQFSLSHTAFHRSSSECKTWVQVYRLGPYWLGLPTLKNQWREKARKSGPCRHREEACCWLLSNLSSACDLKVKVLLGVNEPMSMAQSPLLSILFMVYCRLRRAYQRSGFWLRGEGMGVLL